MNINPSAPIPVAATPPTQPAMPPSHPKRDLVDLVKRIAVTEVRPGDVLVFEMASDPSMDELDEMARSVRSVLGDNTLSLIVNGKFGGALRAEALDATTVAAATEAARGATRAWQGHKYDQILPHMVVAAVRAVIEGGRS